MIKFMSGYEEGNPVYEIESYLISQDSLLDILERHKKEDIIFITDPNLRFVIDYLKDKPLISDEAELITLNYWGVYRSYERIYADDAFFRANMYNSEYANDPMNTDDYYMLSKPDAFRWEYIEFVENYNRPSDLLFREDGWKMSMYISNYVNLTNNLHPLHFLFDLANEIENNESDNKSSVVNPLVAGKYVFKLLIDSNEKNILPLHGDPEELMTEMIPGEGLYEFNSRQPEVDVFIVNTTPENMLKYIDVVGEYIGSQRFATEIGWNRRIVDKIEVLNMRTKDAISMICTINQIQVLRINFILKAYLTVSEVLHGFDIDCECIGWDGKDVWMTERCKYAISRGYNTVDLTFTSTNYEYKLAYYALEGIAVSVPDIEDYTLIHSIDSPGPEEQGLSLLMELNFLYTRYHTQEYGAEYREQFDRFVSYDERVVDVFMYTEDYDLLLLIEATLEEVLTKDEMRVLHDMGELPEVFNIMHNVRFHEFDARNHKRFPINVIASYSGDATVSDLLTINSGVYKVMKVIDGVEIPQYPEIIMSKEGDQVTNVFYPVVYDNPEDWYIGTHVPEKIQ